MINLANLNFKRVIMHEINAKEDSQPHATVKPAKDLFELTPDAKKILLERITDSAGKNSKAFELEIGNSSADTFYDISSKLKGKSDKIFIEKSADIAYLLASKQTKTNIPGGYLLVIQAEEKTDKSFVIIVIKAELHEAFRSAKSKGKSVLEVLNDIFLSPSQKLFKLAIMYEKPKGKGTKPNSLYGCFLFDDQFRRNTKPAEYFYLDFLGFDVTNNAKIQSQAFFNETSDFIISNFTGTKEKIALLQELKNVFSINTETTVTPSEFSATFFKDPKIKDKYAAEVIVNFHASIVKDPTLIDFQLNHKKLNFPNKIKLSGPEDSFDQSVKLIQDSESLKALDPKDTTYTIVRIIGQPFSND